MPAPTKTSRHSTGILRIYLTTAAAAILVGLAGHAGSRFGVLSADLVGLVYVGLLYLLLAANVVYRDWRDRAAAPRSPGLRSSMLGLDDVVTVRGRYDQPCSGSSPAASGLRTRRCSL